ncbi:MAG: PilW family protein [Opitutales bacterium]
MGLSKHSKRRIASGFTLTETMVSLTVFGIVMAAALKFWVSTTESLYKSRGELIAVQEKRETVQLLKSDARKADYILTFSDTTSMSGANPSFVAPDSTGNVTLFVTNAMDSNKADESDSEIAHITAYHLDEVDGVSTLLRTEFDSVSLDALNSSMNDSDGPPSLWHAIAKILDGSTASTSAEPIGITKNFQGNLPNGHLFHVYERDSIFVNGSLKDGKGNLEFQKTVNLTLNASST